MDVKALLLDYMQEHNLNEMALLRRINNQTEAGLLVNELRICLKNGELPRHLRDYVVDWLTKGKTPKLPIPAESTLLEPGDVPEYTPNELSIIRRTLQAHKDKKEISVEKLCMLIFDRKVTEAEAKTLQRFLSGTASGTTKRRGEEPPITQWALYAERLDYPDPSHDIGMAMAKMFPISQPMPKQPSSIRFYDLDQRSGLTSIDPLGGQLPEGCLFIMQTTQYPGQPFIGLSNGMYDGAMLSTNEGYVAIMRDRFESLSLVYRSRMSNVGFLVGEINLKLQAIATRFEFPDEL